MKKYGLVLFGLLAGNLMGGLIIKIPAAWADTKTPTKTETKKPDEVQLEQCESMEIEVTRLRQQNMQLQMAIAQLQLQILPEEAQKESTNEKNSWSKIMTKRGLVPAEYFLDFSTRKARRSNTSAQK